MYLYPVAMVTCWINAGFTDMATVDQYIAVESPIIEFIPQPPQL